MIRCKIMLIKISIIVLPIIAIFVFLRVVLPYISNWHSLSSFKGEVDNIETKHFRFFIQKSEQKIDKNYIAKLSEDFCKAFYNDYKKLFNLKDFDNKPEIFIFSSREDFQNYHKSKFISDLPNNSAYYNPLNNKVILYYSNEIKNTLYHEFTHLMMDVGTGLYRTNWSVWLSEGLAVYFEESRVEDGKIIQGYLNPLYVEVISNLKRNGKLINLERLLSSTHEDFQSENNIMFYYKSFLFVYFFMESKEYKDNFFKFVEHERKNGKTPSYIFWDIINESPEIFEKKFYNFFKL